MRAIPWMLIGDTIPARRRLANPRTQVTFELALARAHLGRRECECMNAQKVQVQELLNDTLGITHYTLHLLHLLRLHFLTHYTLHLHDVVSLHTNQLITVTIVHPT